MEYMQGGELFDYIVKSKKYLCVHVGSLSLKPAKYFSRLLGVLSISISSISYIETSNPRTCSSITIKLFVLSILVYQIPIAKKKDLRLPVALHAMQLPKWLRGRINMRLFSLIFGVVELFFMRCYVVVFLLRTLRHQNSIKRFYQGSIRFPNIYQKMLKIFFPKSSILTLRKDLESSKFANTNGGNWVSLRKVFHMELLLVIIEFQLMTQF